MGVPTVLDIAHLPVEQLPPVVHVPPVSTPFDVTIRPPGSKSLTNRALLLAALADGESILTGALAEADDAQVMIRALRQLGAEIAVTSETEVVNGIEESCGNATIRVKGVAGRWKIKPGETVTLNLNNAGTATRFLTAAAILQPPDSGGIIIDGNERMRERPIGELSDALTQLGVNVRYLRNGSICPPLRIDAPKDLTDLARRIEFHDPASSQFISAMMLTAPFLPAMLTIDLVGKIVSEPYIEMTWRVLQRALSITPLSKQIDGKVSMRIPIGKAKRFDFSIEPDASGATYFAAAAAMCRASRVVIKSLPSKPEDSLQGDIDFFNVLGYMGASISETNAGASVRSPSVALHAIKGDFSPTPDTAMTAAVLACFATLTRDNPTATSELRGLRTLRVKETDRLEALRCELSKLGATVRIERSLGDDAIRITPNACHSNDVFPITFDTYDDHRMAMSLALIGLRRPNVFINNPACVRKTYPMFWRDLAKLYRTN